MEFLLSITASRLVTITNYWAGNKYAGEGPCLQMVVMMSCQTKRLSHSKTAMTLAAFFQYRPANQYLILVIVAILPGVIPYLITDQQLIPWLVAVTQLVDSRGCKSCNCECSANLGIAKFFLLPSLMQQTARQKTWPRQQRLHWNGTR